MNSKIVLSGLLLIVVGIALGAFGAHGLKSVVSPEKVASFEVGIRYQLYHGLALLIIGLNAEKFSFSLQLFSRLLMAGVMLFSLSIYVLSLTEILPESIKFLGPVTPIGGLLMIIAWIILIVRLVNVRQKS